AFALFSPFPPILGSKGKDRMTTHARPYLCTSRTEDGEEMFPTFRVDHNLWSQHRREHHLALHVGQLEFHIHIRLYERSNDISCEHHECRYASRRINSNLLIRRLHMLSL